MKQKEYQIRQSLPIRRQKVIVPLQWKLSANDNNKTGRKQWCYTVMVDFIHKSTKTKWNGNISLIQDQCNCVYFSKQYWYLKIIEQKSYILVLFRLNLFTTCLVLRKICVLQSLFPISPSHTNHNYFEFPLDIDLYTHRVCSVSAVWIFPENARQTS